MANCRIITIFVTNINLMRIKQTNENTPILISQLEKNNFPTGFFIFSRSVLILVVLLQFI